MPSERCPPAIEVGGMLRKRFRNVAPQQLAYRSKAVEANPLLNSPLNSRRLSAETHALQLVSNPTRLKLHRISRAARVHTQCAHTQGAHYKHTCESTLLASLAEALTRAENHSRADELRDHTLHDRARPPRSRVTFCTCPSTSRSGVQLHAYLNLLYLIIIL